MIGKIERVKLRDIWKHEARDFTTWLRDNIDVLDEVLGLPLSNPEREKTAGKFSVDLVAEDEAGNPVIIENQLERSNHDHLGKLLTYLTSIGAKAAIWIVADPRPEHVGAIQWLNESSSANFYMLKVEGVRIGDSEAAPLLTLIVGPSEESREVGAKKKEMAERYGIRYRFWKGLLEKAKQRTRLHAQITPQRSGWISAGAGRTGLSFNYSIRQHDGHVELCINRESSDENKGIFDSLAKGRENINRAFGGELTWDRRDTMRASIVSKHIMVGGYRDEEKWDEVQQAMIDAMCRLEKGFKPYISKLKI